jgi:hypothetical protein
MDRLAIDDGPPGSPASRDRTFDEVNRDWAMMSRKK